ncbi:MAG: ATP synthase F0 subunit B [Desulfatitalea sp.]|jgi:F-type H+-transporting ATPase subunit b|nr:ATP synthase F0 subunit B [Desulfatitalea sp.]
MIDLNWTVSIQIVNFLVLIYILNIVLYKPVRGMLNQRKAKIDGLEGSVTTANRQIEEKNQAFDAGIKAARMKGQSEKEARMQKAMADEQAIVAEINAKAQKDIAAVKAKIAQDTDAVRVSLETEVDAFADAIARKILGRAA